MAGNITDFAICIDRNIVIGTLPTGTVRVGAAGEPAKIVIGKAATMAQPFCNGIDVVGVGILPFFALPADPNFSGTFVIIGRNSSEPTYWGCADVAALVAQCTVLNSGSDEYTFGEGETGSLSAGNSATRIASCKLYLDINGYALSNSNNSFLAGYFP